MQFASFLGTVFIICSWENNGSLNHDGDLDTDRLVWSFSDVHFIVEDILQVINLKNQLHIYEKNYTYLLWLGFGLAWMIIAKLFCTYLTMYVCWSILGLHSKTTVSKCLLSFFSAFNPILSPCTWNKSLKQAHYITKNEMLKYWRELHHSLPLGHKYLQLGYGVLIPFATNLVWVFWNILKKEFQNRGKSWPTDFF